MLKHRQLLLGLYYFSILLSVLTQKPGASLSLKTQACLCGLSPKAVWKKGVQLHIENFLELTEA